MSFIWRLIGVILNVLFAIEDDLGRVLVDPEFPLLEVFDDLDRADFLALLEQFPDELALVLCFGN